MTRSLFSIREALAETADRLSALYGDRLDRVLLFGSYARNEATNASDVDLLVVLQGEIDEYEEAMRLAPLVMDAWERHGLSVQFVPFPVHLLDDAAHPLLMNVTPEAIDLAEA